MNEMNGDNMQDGHTYRTVQITEGACKRREELDLELVS